MRGLIRIDGVDVPMVANATTPLRYKHLFNENLFRYFNAGLEGDDYVEFAGKLGFVMQAQAAGADMSALTVDDYWHWLESLSGIAIAYASSEIVELFAANQQTTVEAKKKNDPRIAK